MAWLEVSRIRAADVMRKRNELALTINHTCVVVGSSDDNGCFEHDSLLSAIEPQSLGKKIDRLLSHRHCVQSRMMRMIPRLSHRQYRDAI